MKHVHGARNKVMGNIRTCIDGNINIKTRSVILQILYYPLMAKVAINIQNIIKETLSTEIYYKEIQKLLRGNNDLF